MARLISRTEKIINELKKEGKVNTVNIIYTQEYYEEMEKMIYDSKRRLAKSAQEAGKIILD